MQHSGKGKSEPGERHQAMGRGNLRVSHAGLLHGE